MRFISFVFAFLLFVFPAINLMAQDTLVFINGKEVPATNIKINDTQILYNPLNKPQKLKKAETYNIFSIKHDTGVETLIYQQDTLIDDLSLEEMRLFVQGQQDALKYFNTTAVTATSTVIGVASGLTLQFFALVPPAVFATIVGASSPKMEQQPIQDKSLLQSEAYRSGYEAKARNMKIKKALIFGIGGAIIGYAGFRVIEAND